MNPFRFLFLILTVLAIAPVHARTGKDVIIEFCLEDGQYYAHVKDKDRLIPLCPETVLNSLPIDHRLYEDDHARKAFDLLLAPVSDYMRPGGTVYFVPAGHIHFINLAALMAPDGKRSCEKFRFVRISDHAHLPDDRKDFLDHCELILFGGMNYHADPIDMRDHAWWCHVNDFSSAYLDSPGWNLEDVSFGYAEDGTRAGFKNLVESRNEIKFIYQLKKFRTLVHTGSEALEELFRFESRRSHDYAIHVSTHSFAVTPKESMVARNLSEHQSAYKSCGLLFSGAGHTFDGEKMPYGLNDGLLYAEEIADLDMSFCRLLVLGACNTALGSVTQDGVIGLQSAFKEAGVGTILMTLWSINDKASAEFMKRFYTYLHKGKTKHESLDLARRDLIRSEDFSDPIYWAPFIMLD